MELVHGRAPHLWFGPPWIKDSDMVVPSPESDWSGAMARWWSLRGAKKREGGAAVPRVPLTKTGRQRCGGTLTLKDDGGWSSVRQRSGHDCLSAMVGKVEDSGMKLGWHSLAHGRLRGGDAVKGIGDDGFELAGAVLGAQRREMRMWIGVGDVVPFYRLKRR
jgi:hypothetical protein